MSIIVCAGPPMREHASRVLGVRWCFKCRKRLRHAAVLMVADCDPLDDWYGPHVEVRCDGCGEEHCRFPGTADGPLIDFDYERAEA